MTFRPPLKRTISLLLVASLINLLVDCIYYKPIEVPRDQPIIVDPDKEIILHQGDGIWLVTEIEISNQHIRGTLSHADLIIDRRPKTEKRKAEETHLYIGPSVSLEYDDYGLVNIPITAIEKIEIYDVAVDKTLFAWVGGGVAAIGAIWLIILLTKESCPFVYAHTGEDYEFAGEVFSGAIYRPLERHDYLPLPMLEPADHQYRMKITNEVREIQYINLAELLVVNHPAGTAALFDKYGTIHTVAQPHHPLRAVSLNEGKSIAKTLVAADEQAYLGEDAVTQEKLSDGVILTFDRPPHAQVGKLVLRAKNSFWLDYIYGQFMDLFGDLLADWEEDQDNANREKLLKWLLAQGIPLSVYLETEQGWEYVDYFNVIGPMAYKDDVLAVDLSKVRSDSIKVKLQSGFMFWELDYIAMDFSPDQSVIVSRQKIETGLDQNGTDVRHNLLAADSLYYRLPEIGDEAVLTFEVPAQPENVERSAFLHTRGYYRILRQTSGQPDIAYLESFRRPGAFNQFSNERLLKLLQKVSD